MWWRWRALSGVAVVEIVAEIGTAHGGDAGRAERLVDAAADAGADCCKTQIVFADEILHPATGAVHLSRGAVDLYLQFKEMERGSDFFGALKERAERRGMGFLVSVFGTRSLDIAIALGLPRIKIASPELNHIPLLRAVAATGKEVVLSSGVSSLGDIEAAVGCFRGTPTLLHCVTSYPTPEREMNLRLIPAMRGLWGLPVGLSDHSQDPLVAPSVAAALGASPIEKHLALEGGGGHLDDSVALTPTQFSAMVRAVRALEGLPSEEAQAFLRARYGVARVQAVLGDGIKRLAPSERPHYPTTNRSILARRDISVGEKVNEDTCGIYRSETRAPGLAPRHWEAINGVRVQRGVHAGCGIQWADLVVR